MARLTLTTLAVALAAVLSAAGAAHAQIGRSDAPIRITSKVSEYLQNEGLGVWSGDVIATQADMRITAEKLTAVCNKAPAGAEASQSCEDLTQLVAEGNVLFTTPDAKIHGDKATYDYGTRVITITGDVISSDKNSNIVHGTEIVYNVDEGRVRFTAGNSRVLSIITPKKKEDTATPATPGATTPGAATPAPANRPN